MNDIFARWARSPALSVLTLALLCGASGVLQAQTPAPASPPVAPGASAAPAAGPAVDPARIVRAEFATPLQAAQALFGEGKTAEALVKLKEAEAVPGLTPWESWLLHRTRASVAQKANDTPGTIQSLEAALLTQQADKAEEISLTEVLVNLSFNARDDARVLRWSAQYDKLQGPNDGVRVMRIQAQANTGDEAGAKTAMSARLEAADQAGRAMPESHLRLLLSLQNRSKDPGAQRTLERLVAVYPRPEYWSDLVSWAARQPGLSDRALLELYRLLNTTGNLKSGDLRYEMAQLALRAGQPAEAQKLVDDGYASGAMGTGALAAEQNRFRDQVRRAVTGDKADRANAEAAAKRAADGTALADLGWTGVVGAASPAEIEAGLAMIEQGIAKGSLRRAPEARLHLGMAQLQAGRKDAAKQTLSSLATQSASDPLALPIRLWNLYAQAPATLPPRQ